MFFKPASLPYIYTFKYFDISRTIKVHTDEFPTNVNSKLRVSEGVWLITKRMLVLLLDTEILKKSNTHLKVN